MGKYDFIEDTENKIIENVNKKAEQNNEQDKVKILLEYKQLLDQGILTQEEFDIKKADILSKVSNAKGMVCPKCGTEMEEIIKGGFTCPKCKKEQDKLFEEIEKNNNEYKEKKTTGNNKNDLTGCLVAIIIMIIIAVLIIKGIISFFGIITGVSDYSGRTLAMEYVDKNSYSTYLIFNTTYTIGKIVSYDDSLIIEQKDDKYIFSVVITYNPKLNSGSTDITKENTGTTYVVYNDKTKKYNCYPNIDLAKSSDIWTN